MAITRKHNAAVAKRDRELKKRLAAFLRGAEGLTEAQIGYRLGGISVSAVCGLLKSAKDEGLITEKIVYSGGALSEADDDALYVMTFQSELHAQIVERLHTAGRYKPPQVYLYDLGPEGGNEVALPVRLRSFAKRAAPELRRLLTRPSVKIAGVSWGGVVGSSVNALAELALPSRAENPVIVIPLCGEPLDHRPTNESSSAITENLSLALNGSREHAKSLGIAPAYIPASEPGERDCIWRSIVATEPYLEVFGAERLPSSVRPRAVWPNPPLCDSMDAFLTGVSVEGGTLGYRNTKIFRPAFLDPRKLEGVMWGDLGGIPLVKPALTPDQTEILRDFEVSWTGVTRQAVEACVARGHNGHPTARPPGCILVAVGEPKARTVYQAVVAEGLVNHLFLDFACAEALKRLLSQPSG